ncbi:MAG: hypothetical protein U0525_01305 [Patescibacteria group bacterium]
MLWFYRNDEHKISHSKFLELPPEAQAMWIPHINDQKNSRVEVLVYCLMPTHYHLLLMEKKKGGISNYLSKIQNSFTRFYNLKNRRAGQIFRGHFKSKPLSSEELLKHVARYIHLNPYSSGLVNSERDLKDYPWSSLHEIFVSDLIKKSQTTNSERLLSFFGDSVSTYMKFLMDQAEYQKTLEMCKSVEKFFQKQ